jgi:hypothetical protein
MLATSTIYLLGLALCLCAGVGITALVQPQGRWLTPAAPASGAAVIIVLSFAFGFLLPGSTTAILVCVAIGVLLALGVWRRLARAERALLRPELRGALAISAGEWAVLVLGAVAGMLLLIPVFSIGFPTTIASGIADGWARSVYSEWLIDNPLIDSSRPTAIDRPIGTYSVLPHELGAGYEYLITLVSTLIGRRTYQVAMPVAALAAPIALSGWASLQAVITGSRTKAWQALVLAAAVASPAFVLPLVENYLTQLVSIALWPIAMAATAAFLLRPSIGSAALGAIGLAAVVGVYPPLAPWFGPPALLLVLVGARHVPAAIARRTPPRLRLVAPAAVACLVLGLALLILAPVELARGYESVVLFSGILVSNQSFPLFQSEQDLAIVLGGASQFSFVPFGAGLSKWQLVPVLILLLGAAAVGVASALTMARQERRLVVALGASVSAITLATYLKYKFGDDYGYGAYKALISGGALLAGLLMVALSSPSARWAPARLAAAGICAAMWVPVTGQMLQRQRDGAQGFRESENALIAALEKLPVKDVVLVEGAAENAQSFQLRQTTGYVAAAFERRTYDGLGSTFSYYTAGGAQPWRPARPWDEVVVSNAPSAFPAHRRTLWERPPYRIQAASLLDVTPFAIAPAPPIGSGANAGRYWITPPPGSPPSDYIAGRVEVIVANRGEQEVTARLKLRLMALKRDRSVVIASEGNPTERLRLPAKALRSVTHPVVVPAGATVRVTLDPGKPVLGGDGSLTPLVALTRVDVN